MDKKHVEAEETEKVDDAKTNVSDSDATRKPCKPYMQNRELSWLTFNERVLDQGADSAVPLFERLQFVSIFCSNLQEFFMVRVGSLTDLSLLKKEVIDTKSMMTPAEQLDAIYARCHELYPQQEKIYRDCQSELATAGVCRKAYRELDGDQLSYLTDYLHTNVTPFLSPQIINARHPFPHLENGALYIIVRLTEEENKKKKSEMTKEEREAAKEARKKAKNMGAEGVTLGIIPLPKQARRVIPLPGDGFNFILLEDALEAMAGEVYSMYAVKHANIICVTRNADLDATEGSDEREDDYREHMKKILKKRARLAPVRLESKHKLSATVSEFLLTRLNLKPHQVFITSVPLDMGYAFALPGMVDEETRLKYTSAPFSPSWPGVLKRSQRIMEQVQQKDVLLSYPYESMDPFVQMLREAAADPDVVSIKITLYRLANQSHLAEALISAAEAGKEVTALFELRARFDESNNITWSQRFEEAGANVIYGFHDYKVHSKICCITRQTPEGLQYITQLGTGNYNEKTAKLYTDFSYITIDPAIGRDANEFFRNMGLEATSRGYQTLWVAPLQIKQNILAGIDEQIELARAGKPCGCFFKTNSVTDKDVIEKIEEASIAGVPIDLLVRGISCLIPQVPGCTENVHVVSIVGRLLEHSRIYAFGPHDDMKIYLSSADLMTRNMDKRIEIAWPIQKDEQRKQVIGYIDTCMRDTAKLRELRADGTYTALREKAVDAAGTAIEPFNAQEFLIADAKQRSEEAHEQELSEKTAFEKLNMQASDKRRADAAARAAAFDLEETYREALKHEVPAADDEALAPFIKAAAKAFAEMQGVPAPTAGPAHAANATASTYTEPADSAEPDKAKAAEAAEQAKEKAEEAAAEVRDKAAKAAEQAKLKAVEAAEDLKERAAVADAKLDDASSRIASAAVKGYESADAKVQAASTEAERKAAAHLEEAKAEAAEHVEQAKAEASEHLAQAKVDTATKLEAATAALEQKAAVAKAKAETETGKPAEAAKQEAKTAETRAVTEPTMPAGATAPKKHGFFWRLFHNE